MHKTITLDAFDIRLLTALQDDGSLTNAMLADWIAAATAGTAS